MPGGFATPNTPNLADFLVFLSTSVQIPTAALPSNSVWPGYAFTQAFDLAIPAPLGILYSLAVYNCATHILFMITPDVTGQSYFESARASYKLLQISTGLVVSASDETTSSTLTAPKWADGLLPQQLQFMKTPWGRVYLQWAGSAGPNIVGLS